MPRPLPGCQLIRVLRNGPVTEVWLGRLDGEEQPIVVKRAVDPADEDTLQRLVEAGAVAAAAAHPDLRSPRGTIDDPPGLAVVYPYVEGGTLRCLLDERGALSAGELVALFSPVAAMLDALAPSGFVHGDLTPSNILLRTDGTPLVIDPGTPGAAVPAYADPTFATGREPCARSDVFSLGVIAYEALIGRLPHRGEPAEILALAAAGAHRRLDTWPGVSPDVAVVVETALSADPSQRHDDAASFLEALSAVVDPEEVRLPGPVANPGTTLVPPEDETLEFGPRPDAAAESPARTGGWRAALRAAISWPSRGRLARWPTRSASSNWRCP
ncbi:MAG: protein kinase [Acidimicrobiales bacterium]|nr:protein kinase [Acidimicrobiales bacterium]